MATPSIVWHSSVSSINGYSPASGGPESSNNVCHNCINASEFARTIVFRDGCDCAATHTLAQAAPHAIWTGTVDGDRSERSMAQRVSLRIYMEDLLSLTFHGVQASL